MLSSVFPLCTSVHSEGVRTEWLMRRAQSQRCCRKAAIASLDSTAARSEANSRSTSTSEYGKSCRRPYPPTASTAAVEGRKRAAASRTIRSTCALRSANAVSASPVARNSCRRCASWASEGRFAAVIVADPDGFGHVEDEDLAVADLAGPRGAGESLDHLVETAGWNHQFQLHFGQEVDVVFLSAVHLFVALLASVSAHVGDGHAVDADGFESFLDFVELERLDDGFDLLHGDWPLRLEYIPLFAVHAGVQAVDFLLLGDAHPNGGIDDFQNDERAHNRQYPGDQHTDGLVADLARLAVHQAQWEELARRILEAVVDHVGGKNTGQ